MRAHGHVGAFHHYLGSTPKYRTRLLDHFEARCTTAVIDGVEASDTLPARERLDRLLAEAAKAAGRADRRRCAGCCGVVAWPFLDA
ncbi:hypothetical protein AV521_39580 [Streptomyces sp. IMTB 2501]|uniref:hypothetical protein n=1 Tax=Streptomyces sp. IMTB 2501 TaxID=1776340 RepID=UPI00096C3A15|nr:hypothetical protein [Streptomyces sp. IMTB 2501]OLZ63282.1 hypothetical protein AV521_39580 [Streptomyces sp. IMTB 2501]